MSNEKPRCRIYREPCPAHGFIHGAEAEELREGIEKFLGDDGDVSTWSLRSLLDRVDARDSLAYLEATRNRKGKRSTESTDGGTAARKKTTRRRPRCLASNGDGDEMPDHRACPEGAKCGDGGTAAPGEAKGGREVSTKHAKYPGGGYPWADFLNVRARVLAMWEREGKTPEECVRLMSMDPMQVLMIRMTVREHPEEYGGE